MPPSPNHSSPPAAVIDTLNGLLEAELNNIFRFMGEGYPFLNRASADIRRPLHDIVTATDRRAAQLADTIDLLGGTPLPRSIQPEEQYLAFLSIKFLLPKLVTEKKLLIQRYENAIKVLPRTGDAAVLVHHLLDEHNAELRVLEQAAQQVAVK